MKLNKTDNNALPFPVALVYGMDIETKDKKTIKNFCEDFNIEMTVDDKYLSLPIAVIEKVAEDEPEGVQKIFNGPVRASNFRITKVDEEGVVLLMVEYDSNMMEKYFSTIADIYREIDHDPELTFVIAHHYEGDHDLDNLSYHFNRYLPLITASGDISGLYDDTETNAIMLGFREFEVE